MIATAFTTDVEKLFYIQKAHHSNVAKSSYEERLDKLTRLEKAMMSYRSEIHAAIYKDFRKSPSEADLNEIYTVLSEVRFAISNLRSWMKPKRVPTPMALMGTSSYIRYEAKGVVLIISPWNFPFNLTFIPMISAIAAGNSIILKPSEMTPHSSALMKKMMAELFEEKEIAVVEGGVETSTELLKLPFNHIFFTGAPSIGKVVMRAAADHLASVTLELGGKCPVVIDESADLEDTANKITWGKFMNNGQICIAPDYILVQESVKPAFLDAMKKSIQNFYGNDEATRQKSDSYCRIVNARHFNRLESWLKDAVDKGAKVVIGGATDASENYIAPTVLDNVTKDMTVMREEIFGPLLPVVSFKTMVDAYNYINAGEKPLAMYVFSHRSKDVDVIMENTSAGATCINDLAQHYLNPHLPFGGVNFSGVGKSKGHFGFEEFSNQRAVLRQHLFKLNAIKMLHPPYGEKTQKLLSILMKWM